MDSTTTALVRRLNRQARQQVVTQTRLVEHLAVLFADRLVELYDALSEEEKKDTFYSISLWLSYMERGKNSVVVIFDTDAQLHEIRSIAREIRLTGPVSTEAKKILSARNKTVYLDSQLTIVSGF